MRRKKIILVLVGLFFMAGFALVMTGVEDEEIVCSEIKTYSNDFVGALPLCSVYVEDGEVAEYNYPKLNSKELQPMNEEKQ